MLTKLYIPERLKELIRKLPTDPDPEIGITRYGEEKDLVFTDYNVPRHVDNDGSDRDKNVIMCVLVNDGHRKLGRYGFSHITITPGKIIRFDGSKTHELYGLYHDSPARFAAIIWDVDVNVKTKNLLDALQNRVMELTNELLTKERNRVLYVERTDPLTPEESWKTIQ